MKKERVEELKSKALRISTIMLITAAGVGAAVRPAFADGPTDPGNSTPGVERYLANPGGQQAAEVGAQNGSGAGSATRGYLGKDNSMGTEKVHCDTCGSYPGPGTEGYQTGLNNSGVAGNRQGNLP